MEDNKYCPLCYCLSDVSLSNEALMCEKERCMWWKDGDCICNTVGKALVILSNIRQPPVSY